VRGGLKEG
jgi:hypothetical protein